MGPLRVRLLFSRRHLICLPHRLERSEKSETSASLSESKPGISQEERAHLRGASLKFRELGGGEDTEAEDRRPGLALSFSTDLSSSSKLVEMEVPWNHSVLVSSVK